MSWKFGMFRNKSGSNGVRSDEVLFTLVTDGNVTKSWGREKAEAA
jgi:hypothetical protein